MSHRWLAMCFGVVTLTACRSPSEPTANLAAALRVTVTDVRVVQGGSVSRPLRGLTFWLRLENTARDSLQYSQCSLFLEFFDVASSRWWPANGGCGFDESLQWKVLVPGQAFERTVTYFGVTPGIFPVPWPVGGLSGNVSGTYRVSVIVGTGGKTVDPMATSNPFVVVDAAGR